MVQKRPWSSFKPELLDLFDKALAGDFAFLKTLFQLIKGRLNSVKVHLHIPLFPDGSDSLQTFDFHGFINLAHNKQLTPI